MQRPRTARRLATLLAAAAVTVSATAVAVPAQAHTRHASHALGQRSLATVLAADGNHVDRNWNDFDILDKVVHLVLAAKPDSPVAVLADGSAKLTAFLPTDRAFRRLAHSLTGHWYRTEGGALNAIASAPGVNADLLESVLLYHVVPGARVTYRQARHADGAVLSTALSGASITVKVRRHRVILRDVDPDNVNPQVLRSASDINKGNRQIAHGIDQVLRPIDL